VFTTISTDFGKVLESFYRNFHGFCRILAKAVIVFLSTFTSDCRRTKCETFKIAIFTAAAAGQKTIWPN
jgi:hypothetical protein